MKYKERTFYRRKYQNELIEELTGKNIRAVQATMRRKGITLKEYLNKLFN